MACSRGRKSCVVHTPDAARLIERLPEVIAPPHCRAGPRGWLEYTIAHFVVVDEELLDLVHERWRQVIEIAHFGVETRASCNGNHAVIADGFPLLRLLGCNHPNEPGLNQT